MTVQPPNPPVSARMPTKDLHTLMVAIFTDAVGDADTPGRGGPLVNDALGLAAADLGETPRSTPMARMALEMGRRSGHDSPEGVSLGLIMGVNWAIRYLEQHLDTARSMANRGPK